MNWQPLFEIVVELIKQCMAEGKSEEEILARIEDPGPVLELVLERRTRSQLNMSRREWRRNRKAIRDLSEEQRREAALELIEMAREQQSAEKPEDISTT